MRKRITRTLCFTVAATLVFSASATAKTTNNTEAPRSYFPYPAEIESLPKNFGLPDLFKFFDKSADPNGNGKVDTPEEWNARAAELKDMLSYYVFGYRRDPLKSDTTITKITNNYSYSWVNEINQGEQGTRGWSTKPPMLPEGSYTMTVLDLTRYGDRVYYFDYVPVKNYVHKGSTFQSPEGHADWKDGDTWEKHKDLVKETLLPAKTVHMSIKDTNPKNSDIRSKDASEGIEYTFTIRFPEKAPVVDGVTRNAKASRNGTGYPVVVTIGNLSEEQILTLVDNGYAYISVDNSSNPDNGELSVYEKLYPPVASIVHNDNSFVNPYTQDSGDLMHTGWIASRALDAIENYMLLSDNEKAKLSESTILPNIDVYSSAITGCSNMAKRAFVGGFFDTGDNGDTRFDIIALSDSGGGGLTGFRYSTEGQLFSYEPPVQNKGYVEIHDYAYGLNESIQRAIQNTGEDHWFCDRAQIFTVRPDLAENTPFDLHAMVAAFANTKENRYFLTWTGEGQDAWLNSPSTVLTVQAASEVYDFLGKGDNIGCIVRDQAHANQDRDLPDLIAIMDHAYYGVDKYVRKFHDTLTINPTTGATDHLTAADGSGTILPTKIFKSVAAMSRNPYYIPSTYLKWSRPGKHVLWTETNSVTEGVPLTFTFHTDAKKVDLVLTDGKTKLSGNVNNGIAEIALTANQAKAGQYTATAIGGMTSKTIEICGWTTNDALRHSIVDNSALGHDVGSGVAFTTPLINYNSTTDPVRLYMNGKAIPTDIYDYDNKVYTDTSTLPQSGYLQPYGATLMLYENTKGFKAPMGSKVVFGIRNAKLEALQGYTIAMDIEYEKYNPNASNPQTTVVRQRFRPTYKTLTPQTPVWAPRLLQNTPKSSLPLDEEYWPILGNWRSDFDVDGKLKPVSQIRPINSEMVQPKYNAKITAGSVNTNSVVIKFSTPVNPNDFGLAINMVKGVSFKWAGDNKSVRINFDAPVKTGTKISAFVFRSVDSSGNMIGSPVELTFKVK